MCWIDLLLLAEWRKERTFFLRGIEVVVKRGQVAMALADLHKRWNLSINTVRARLREMVKDGRITIKPNNVVTVITIINWEKYQGTASSECNQDDTAPAPDYVFEQSEKADVVESSKSKETEDAPVLIPVDVNDDCQVAELVSQPKPKPKKSEVDCDFILRLYHDRCPSLPKVLKLSEKRKMKIRVRFEEMEYNYEILQQVFDKAQASRFMRGDNNRGWSADFDWIFANNTNWVKILEGKYDNKDSKVISTPITNNGYTEISCHPATVGGGFTPTTPSQRQKLSVLTTLAKIEQEHGENGEHFATGTCFEE